MKKFWIPVFAIGLLLVFRGISSFSHPEEPSEESHPLREPTRTALPNKVPTPTTHAARAEDLPESHHVEDTHPPENVHRQRRRTHTEKSLGGQGSKDRSKKSEPFRRTSHENGPSIGRVQILGHHGCDLHTPGWFLSAGTPEQYDFTVSEDGETLVVEPNIPSPTGNFEFVHCADAKALIGKRVRFSAKVKAKAVTRTALLRLRGEDDHWDRTLYANAKAAGTYDWKTISVEAEVGSETSLFSYGLTFQSPGKLWISHPVFEVLP